MKRWFLIGLLATTSLVLQAQRYGVTLTYNPQYETSGVKEYAKSVGIFVARPKVSKDAHARHSTAAWHMTNMEWIKDYCEAKNVSIEKDYLRIFRGGQHAARRPTHDPHELATDGRKQ